MTTYTVPLPDGLPVLSLNDRQHWAARNRAAQTWRMVVNTSVRTADVPKMSRCKVSLHVTPPDRRRRDRSNLVASAKVALDGLVDSGRIPDDSPQFVDDSVPVVLHDPDGSRKWRMALVIEDLSEVAA